MSLARKKSTRGRPSKKASSVISDSKTPKVKKGKDPVTHLTHEGINLSDVLEQLQFENKGVNDGMGYKYEGEKPGAVPLSNMVGDESTHLQSPGYRQSSLPHLDDPLVYLRQRKAVTPLQIVDFVNVGQPTYCSCTSKL